MKNLSIILNVVLFIAVIVLYVLHFSGKGGKQSSDSSETRVIGVDDVAIAYVNTDTVLSKYELFEKLSKDLEDKQKTAQQNLRSRQEGFQREVQDYQSNAGNLTINQAKALEENLRQKQQNLYQYEQSLSQQLMQQSNEMNEHLNEKLNEFLKNYGKKNNLQLVLAYTNHGDVLFADDSLDITSEVISGLNQEYAAEQNGSKPSEADSTKAK